MYTANRREFLCATSALAGIASGLISPAMAAESDPIALLKVLFGYPPGGAGDVITRGIGQRITGSYAKAVIVENKPGAAGRLVMESVKTAATDGSAVLVSPSSVLAMYPHVYKKLSYDSFTDITPVTTLCDFVHGLASVREHRSQSKLCRILSPGAKPIQTKRMSRTQAKVHCRTS